MAVRILWAAGQQKQLGQAGVKTSTLKQVMSINYNVQNTKRQSPKGNKKVVEAKHYEVFDLEYSEFRVIKGG